MRRATRSGVSRIWALGTLTVLLIACGKGERGAPSAKVVEPPPEALSKETESGPVKARVQLWPTAPSLGDPIYLRLTVEAKPGVDAEAPFEHEALGRFRVIGWTQGNERRDDGTVVELQTYTLDAPGSGKFRVPPLRVTFAPPGAAADAVAVELLTEELPLTVAAIDPARAAQPLAPPQGKVTPSRTVDYTLVFVIGGPFTIALLIFVVWLLLKLRRRRVRQERISAYDAAVARLERLAGGGAPDAAAADAWFVELSSIVRHYLEDRYGVRAPELTTEEFLQEARRAAGLPGPQRELLTAFLERCDRVKFAGYRPDADESMATLKAARAFVEDTRLRPQEAA